MSAARTLKENNKTNINKINKPDVAFGDRLNWWTQAIVIGKILKFEYQLQFNIADYPETYFFKYPKSVFLPTNEFYRGINQFEYLTTFPQEHPLVSRCYHFYHSSLLYKLILSS